MSGAIVSAQSPEEREYARYLAEIEHRKHRAAELEAELSILQVALARFNVEYHARVGRLFIQLDRINLAVDEYERRLAQLAAHPNEAPASIEETLREEFTFRREEIHRSEQENRGYEEAFSQEAGRPLLTEGAKTHLKALYYDLCRRFHPDLARTDEERLRRNLVMRRINEAFAEGSLEQLQRLAHEIAFDDPAFEQQSVGDKLVWAIREVARLDDLIAGLVTEVGTLKKSPLHGLWSRQEAGESVLDALALDLEQEISVQQHTLDSLITNYRVLIGDRHRRD